MADLLLQPGDHYISNSLFVAFFNLKLQYLKIYCVRLILNDKQTNPGERVGRELKQGSKIASGSNANGMNKTKGNHHTPSESTLTFLEVETQI